MKQNYVILIFTVLGLSFLSSCEYLDTISNGTKNIAEKILPKSYKSNIQQGTSISDSDLAKLKLGMSKNEVKKTIGSPDVIDPFHKNRWDYINHSRIGDTYTKSSFVLVFDNDNTLIKIEK